MMGFLAPWARRLSWRETAQAFQTSWEAVYRSVEWFVEWGLEHRQLDGVTSIGVDEIHWGHGTKADNTHFPVSKKKELRSSSRMASNPEVGLSWRQQSLARFEQPRKQGPKPIVHGVLEILLAAEVSLGRQD
jgi:hypothetical protein